MITNRGVVGRGAAGVALVLLSVTACSGSSSGPSVPKSAAAGVSAIPSGDPTPTAGRVSAAVLHKDTGGVNASYVGVSSAQAKSYRAGLVKDGWTRVGGEVTAKQDGIDNYEKEKTHHSIGVGYDSAKRLLTVAYYPG
ncbi:hypothetical protein [uncultured Jatrophihabitans sp.]|uniref:hypothetical protein n=1 Tax=uncultured Jatrophihabitans sp. TaxID=1610747 RepID=UPI0035CAE765